MKAIEQLKQTMREDGLKDIQIESAAAKWLINFFANHAEIMNDLARQKIAEAEEIFQNVESARNRLKEMESKTKRDLDLREKTLDKREERIAEMINEGCDALKKIKSAQSELMNLETAEARDRLRLAMFYMQHTDDGFHNQKAFTYGLGNIIGSGYDMTGGTVNEKHK